MHDENTHFYQQYVYTCLPLLVWFMLVLINEIQDIILYQHEQFFFQIATLKISKCNLDLA